MKFSVSTYSFSQLLQSGELTQLQTLEVSKNMGFDGVELLGLDVPEGMTEEAYMDLIKAECERLDLEISNFTMGAELLKTGEALEEQINKVKHGIDCAAYLGAKSIRHDATGGYSTEEKKYKGFDQALPHLIEVCRQITEYGATKGVETMVENHGVFCQDSERLERLITGVGHENFGVLLDMGNFLCVDEDPIYAVSRLKNYAKYVHAKDFICKSGSEANPGRGFFRTRGGNYLRGTVIGQGNVPVKQVLDNLQHSGYSGYVAMEFEGMEPTILAIEIGLENLKNYVG